MYHFITNFFAIYLGIKTELKNNTYFFADDLYTFTQLFAHRLNHIDTFVICHLQLLQKDIDNKNIDTGLDHNMAKYFKQRLSEMRQRQYTESSFFGKIKITVQDWIYDVFGFMVLLNR